MNPPVNVFIEGFQLGSFRQLTICVKRLGQTVKLKKYTVSTVAILFFAQSCSKVITSYKTYGSDDSMVLIIDHFFKDLIVKLKMICSIA